VCRGTGRRRTVYRNGFFVPEATDCARGDGQEGDQHTRLLPGAEELLPRVTGSGTDPILLLLVRTPTFLTQPRSADIRLSEVRVRSGQLKATAHVAVSLRPDGDAVDRRATDNCLDEVLSLPSGDRLVDAKHIENPGAPNGNDVALVLPQRANRVEDEELTRCVGNGRQRRWRRPLCLAATVVGTLRHRLVKHREQPRRVDDDQQKPVITHDDWK